MKREKMIPALIMVITAILIAPVVIVVPPLVIVEVHTAHVLSRLLPLSPLLRPTMVITVVTVAVLPPIHAPISYYTSEMGD